LTGHIDHDPVLAASLVGFAGEIGAKIVAAGIETESELGVLRSSGASCGQDGHLGRPTPLQRAASRCEAFAGALRARPAWRP
jgi:EAL domain-containing protein (putative c-di-GMP-specific phosphodiesterase class I)